MGLLGVISGSINIIINLAGVVMLVFLILNFTKLSYHEKIIGNATGRKATTSVFDAETREVRDVEEEERITPDTIRSYGKQFYKDVSDFNVYSQLVPVFPLLGLFGTVIGLARQISAADITQLMDSLNLALYSTIWGLLWAIILKVFIAVLPSKSIEKTEIMLEDYDKKFDNSIKYNSYPANRAKQTETTEG